MNMWRWHRVDRGSANGESRQRRVLRIAVGPIFDDSGGVSRHIIALQRYSYHDVHVVAPKFFRMVPSKIGRARGLYVRAMSRIISELGLHGYDIVHSHVDPWFMDLCMSSRTDTCRWFHTYHTLYFEEDNPGGLRPWQMKINKGLVETAPQADVRISVSEWLHDHLMEKYAIRTEVIPNGVELEACERADPVRFLRKYGVSDFVLFVGTADPHKNPKLFVELARAMPDERFAMVGPGLDAARLARQYGVSIPKNLALLNEMTHADALDAISACKAYVITSKREGLPTTVLEAMGMGKPAIAPDQVWGQELIPSSDYGFLYEPNSLEDLLEKTRQALASKDVGERAKKRVAENYDWRVLAKRIDSAYERAANG